MFTRSRWFGVFVLILALFALPSAAAASESSHDGRIGFQKDDRIYVMDSDGSNLELITSDASGHNGPLWSPDGTRVAFTSTRGREPGASGLDIYVAELGSSYVHRVTWDSTGGPPSSWSPDGESIVFVSGFDGEIYRVDVAGGAMTRLTTINDPVPYPATSFASPTFSPDGSRIAYVERSHTYVSTGSWPPKAIPVYTGAIFVTDLDGSHRTRLTNTPAPEGSPTKWTDDDQFPAWSPDGTQIAFSSDQGSDYFPDLFVINADGTGRHQITDGTANAFFPAWSPDGAMIAWGGFNEFSFVAASDGTNKITLGDASNPDWSSDGSLIAVSAGAGIATVHPDGSHFVLVEPDAYLGEIRGSPHWQPVFPPVGLADPGSGIWRLRDWGGESAEFYYGNPGDSPFVGDWTCNGTDTPGLYRQSDGFAYLRDSNTQGNADIKFYFGDPGDVPLAGDFNGDGCDTLSMYRPSEARFYIINKLGADEGGLGAAEYSFLFGNLGDKPVVGDWDSDGIDEIGLHREATGFFYYRNTLTTGIADGQFYFGDPGDRFVAGDWGGITGQDTPAVFRPSNTTFYFRYTLTQGNADSQFIWPGAETNWLPISGDFKLD